MKSCVTCGVAATISLGALADIPEHKRNKHLHAKEEENQRSRNIAINTLVTALAMILSFGLTGCFSAMNDSPVLGHPGGVGSTVSAGVLDIATLPLQVAVFGFCALCELPIGGDSFTVRVRDAYGNPVPGALIRGEKVGLISSNVKCITNEKGEATFRHYHEGEYLSRVIVTHKGYYPYGRYYGDTISFGVRHNRKVVDERPVIYDVLMKERRHPVSMSYSIMLPTDSMRRATGDFFYDCEYGDWLPPEGKGKHADLRVSRKWSCPVGEEKVRNPAYRSEVDFAVVNPDDGFIVCQYDANTAFPTLYAAPVDGNYEEKSFKEIHFRNCHGACKHFDKNSYLVMRLRTKRDGMGNVVSAHYGKLLFVRNSRSMEVYYTRQENEPSIESLTPDNPAECIYGGDRYNQKIPSP